MRGIRRPFRLTLAALTLLVASAGQLCAVESYLGLQRSSNSTSQTEHGVQQATYSEPFQVGDDQTRSSANSARANSSAKRDAALALNPSPLEIGETKARNSPLQALGTVVVSLAAVLCLLFGGLWLVRRNLPAAAGSLPTDVVEVLGHAPLAARRQMQLVRFGDKLLLLCISQTGVDTLAEIDRPDEVARLTGLCGATSSANGQGAFQQVFGKRMRTSKADQSATNSGLAAMAMQKRRPSIAEDAA